MELAIIMICVQVTLLQSILQSYNNSLHKQSFSFLILAMLDQVMCVFL